MRFIALTPAKRELCDSEHEFSVVPPTSIYRPKKGTEQLIDHQKLAR